MTNQSFQLLGQAHLVADLDQHTRGLYDLLVYAEKCLLEKKNQRALLTKARNAYIEDIKRDAVRQRTGVDLQELFGDD